MNNVINLGLAYGIYSSILTIIALRIMPEKLFTLSWVTLAIMILGLIVLIFLGRYFLRGDNDSYLSYGSAVKQLFIASLIGTLLVQVTTVALYRNDKDMQTLHHTKTIENSENTLRWGVKMSGASEAEADRQVEEMRDRMESGEIDQPKYPYTWSGIPMLFGVSALFSLIFCLIAGRWVREKEEAQFT